MAKFFKIAILLISIIFTLTSCEMETKGYRDLTGTILIAKGSSSAIPDLSVIQSYTATLTSQSGSKINGIVDNQNGTYIFKNVPIETNMTYTLEVKAFKLLDNNKTQVVAQATKDFQANELSNLNIILDYRETGNGVFNFRVSIPNDTQVDKITVSNTNNQSKLNFNITSHTVVGDYKVFEIEKNIPRGSYNLNVQYFKETEEVHKYSNIHIQIEPRLTSTFNRTELSSFENIIITPTFPVGRDGSTSKPFYVGDEITLEASENALISLDGNTEGSNIVNITLNSIDDNYVLNAVASKEYYCDALFSQTYKVVANPVEIEYVIGSVRTSCTLEEFNNLSTKSQITEIKINNDNTQITLPENETLYQGGHAWAISSDAACGYNANGEYVDNEIFASGTTVTTEQGLTTLYARDYLVSDRGPNGGRIYYDMNTDTDRFLEASDTIINNNSSTVNFGHYRETILWGALGSKNMYVSGNTETSNTSIEVGKGKVNTENLNKFDVNYALYVKETYIDKEGKNTEALSAAKIAISEGNNWYLPSAKELKIMQEVAPLPITISAGYSHLWSSSEYTGPNEELGITDELDTSSNGFNTAYAVTIAGDIVNISREGADTTEGLIGVRKSITF